MTVASIGQLPGIVSSLEALLGQHGYLAVGVLILLEDFGVPAPGETVLVLAAADAGVGRLNIVLVAGLAAAAAVAGDNIGYAIGWYGGRRLLDRFGRYVLLTPARLARAQRFIDRHGGVMVAGARFVEGLRQANGLIAGATGMTWRRFLPFNIIGAIAWVTVWSGLGYALGNHIGVVYDQARRYEIYLLVAAAVAVAAIVVVRIRHTRRQRRAAPPERQKDPPR